MSRHRPDVKPMDKTYIGPQADADVGPISLPPSARSRAAVGDLAGHEVSDCFAEFFIGDMVGEGDAENSSEASYFHCSDLLLL